MSDPRSIQRYGKNSAAPAVMTPQGPAVIQIIDMGGSGELGPVAGAPAVSAKKPGGVNVLSAVLRRWWLVLLMVIVIGGATIFAANNWVKPLYEAYAKVGYSDSAMNSAGRGSVADIVHRAINVLMDRQITMEAVRDDELQKVISGLIQGRNLNDPVVQLDICTKLRGSVEALEDADASLVVRITALRPKPEEAQIFANAYAKAFVAYCRRVANDRDESQIQKIEEQQQQSRFLRDELRKQMEKLKLDNNFVQIENDYANAIAAMQKCNERLREARIEYAATEANFNALRNRGERKPEQELERDKLINEERRLDSILQAYIDQQVKAIQEYQTQLLNKMPDHPDVMRAKEQMERAKANLENREKEIKLAIDNRINRVFDLQDKVSLANAKLAMDKAEQSVQSYTKMLQALNSQSKDIGPIKFRIEKLANNIEELSKQIGETEAILNESRRNRIANPSTKSFTLEAAAELPVKPKDDKRIKVQAAGMVGGLFLGVLLALLVDRFDKRLRNPRDIEPMLGVPLLGTIPRIQELKRIKGEQARNLIAEEFRIIRTQVLFGDPNLRHKVIAITSPTPGDGKTSLAVNLAISIAKAGRRVLLIDGDLRKPDVHRVFNIPDSPGFAELIAATLEPGAAIRKSDIDALDILPAGTPITRPSELLSRPDVGRLLAALGEHYDHIILDTAPLLPVSDTHILAGLVDGVIVSFNAEVDRDTVELVHDILRRSHATVIGSVMNQVKYKQSGSYHRGKSSYDSYYNSPRGMGAASKTAAGGAIAKPQDPHI